jgi:YrbI family 3-deoxy-D-manno-octulosonate 8-phosphate phosphatase
MIFRNDMSIGINKEIMNKLSKIKLVAMDVDGTLTDKGVFYSSDGLAMKRFDVNDGMGIRLLHQSNIETIILTSDDSDIPAKRADKLKMKYKIIGAERKITELNNLLTNIGHSLDEVAYIGDDINDIEVLKMCGVSACPNDAVKSVKEITDIILDNRGGYGAVREFADIILTAQNKPIMLNFIDD